MDLSIIILNYKYKGLVKTCLRNIKSSLTLSAQEGFKLDYEIIVVDNASNDAVDEMIKNNFPEVKLIMLDKNIGYGGGNNAGIKVAQGNYILIVNPDITVLEGAIKNLYEFMENNPEVGIVVPQLLNPNGTIQRSCMRFPKLFTPVYRRLSWLEIMPFVKKHLREFEIEEWDHNSDREVEDWVLGACLMIRGSAIKEAGMFDEQFLLFFEDTDLCRRFKLKGWKIYYLSNAKVIHLDERLSKKSVGLKALKNKTTWIHIESWLKYFWKWRFNENRETAYLPSGGEKKQKSN